jgi:hypothetical protein
VNCDKVESLLSEAIDGALSPMEAREFEEHLAGCPPCRALYGDVRESLALLEELPSIEVGSDFDAAVWKRLRAERRIASGRRVFSRVREWVSVARAGASLRWAVLGAAAALLAWVALSSDQTRLIPGGTSATEVVKVTGSSPAPDVEFTPVEFSAGMPKAVEQFILSDQELTPRYRRSNYNYPFRPVRDPILVPMPVSTGGTAIESPNQTSTTTGSGVPVLAF